MLESSSGGGGGLPGPGRVLPGPGGFSGDPPPPRVDRITDTCKNITAGNKVADLYRNLPPPQSNMFLEMLVRY